MDWKKTGISNKVIEEIQNIALKNHVKKVILFGSRARGDFYRKSDIDLAVEGGNFLGFSMSVDEETSTLLEYDIIELDRGISEKLKDSIKRDGVVIYEKV